MSEKLAKSLTEAYRLTKKHRCGLLARDRTECGLYDRLNELECYLFNALKSLREAASRAAISREDGER